MAGDVRYGLGNVGQQPLPDGSVALHARSLFLPTVRLGGTDLTSDPFIADVPETWEDFFGLTEVRVRELLAGA